MPFKNDTLPRNYKKKEYRYNLNSQHQLNHEKRELRAKSRDYILIIKIGDLENLVLARRFSKSPIFHMGFFGRRRQKKEKNH